MSKPTGNNHSTLSWVRKELDETLRQAAEALETYSQDTSDSTYLQFCGSHLHQVRGILQMLELFGAAMLVEEMEQVVAALLQGEVRQPNDALQVLMQAIIQLGGYLERVQGGLRDAPVLLLPLLNELRAVRNAGLLTEHAVFDLDAARPKGHRSRPPATGEPLSQAARRLRSRFQLGLLGVIRQQDVAGSLARMRDVLDALDAATFDASVGDLWWLAAGLVEALQEGALDNAAAVRSVLGQIDREIRRAAELGEAELVAKPRQELLKNLLYYLARARSDNARVIAIQERYGLKQLLPDEQQLDSARRNLAAPSRQTLQTVAEILKDDLATAKDSLDLYTRSGFTDAERLRSLVEGLRQVADTLGMLGLGEPRRQIQEQIQWIEALLDGTLTPDEAVVLQIAEALLRVDAAIDGFSAGYTADEEKAEEGERPAEPQSRLPAAEYHAIYGTAIAEVVADIGRAKEAVSAMLDAGTGAGGAAIAEQFDKLARTLRMLEQARPADQLAALASHVTARLQPSLPLPEQDVLDTLAEVLAGVEYYLEAVRDGHRPPQRVLDQVDAALARLDAALAPAAAAPAVLDAATAEEPEPVEIAAEPPPEETVEAAPAAAPQPAAQPEPPPASPAAPAAKKSGRIDYDVPVMADEIDPEILEIFVEEAQEVLETLQEEFPRWRANPDDNDALVTVRRMYHTLKGSGRLAGALLLGELAWSVENLLNRVLDGTVQQGPEIHALVAETIAVLPALIEQIQGGPAPQQDILALMRRAEALAQPGQAAAPAALPSSVAPATAPATSESVAVGQQPFAGPEPLPVEPSAEPAGGLAPARPVAELPQAEAAEADAADARAELAAGEPGPDRPDEGQPRPASVAEVAPAAEPRAPEAQPEEQATELAHADDSDCGVPVLQPLEQTGDDSAANAEVAVEPEAAEQPVAEAGMDPVLYDIFRRETADHLAVVSAFITASREAPQPIPVSEALIRALHTLTGSARMADVTPIAQLGRKLELLAEQHHQSSRPLQEAELGLLEEGVALVQEVVRQLAEPAPQWPDTESLLARVDAALAALAASAPAEDETPSASAEPSAEQGSAAVDIDLDLAALFLEEAEDILRFLEMTVDRWEQQPETEHEACLSELHRSLHTLKGGARLAGFEAIASFCHALESLAADVASRNVAADDAFFNLLHGCVDGLQEMLATARDGSLPTLPEELMEAIVRLRGGSEQPAAAAPPAEPADTELVQVFLEEAAEILEATEAALERWQNEPDNEERITDLQRALHTLKGGARMAGFAAIADLSHALETLLASVQQGQAAVTVSLFDLLERIHDRLSSQLEQAAAGQQPSPAKDLLAAIETYREQPMAAAVDDAELIVPVAAPTEPPVAPEPERQAAAPAEAAEAAPEPEPAVPARSGGSSDMVRVRADLLDNMVNLAGEISIYRARLEQQIGAMRFNLGELEQTVARLREQLREMEIETEAQILYRFDRGYEKPDEAAEEFDPLELDRFSRLQELSRALAESTNDLVSIQNLLDNLTRESETLLLQQSRVNTELQDGLMRTRMVPFANLVPRMRRIVRQTCLELGRKAQLVVQGARGEMDRTVLERVTAPLEHMLRNAVAHGIETPAERRAAGKPEEGQITVALSREGADVVIRVSDDGRGLRLEEIRRRAIARGLMPADAPLADREVMQFILEPGFTTSEQVTQIAGRGVGLDVVASEIKQLGGTLEIDSTAGQGTTFTIRLPFTLAVNQALLCQVGEDVYAIPITSVEGVVRMTHEELEQRLASGRTSYYDYAGERYELRGLSTLLGLGEPQLPGPGGRSPIILVQTGDHRLAIQVEALLGSREIVVKSVGPQISTVPGIFGATILADGRVALILDIGSLVRLHLTTGQAHAAPVAAAAEDKEKVTVMVVDDSITMRKVATRLLERNGMAVVTAKDGVDAVGKLQEIVPDAMLLDIEMPRMDGYELATHVRNDERLRHIPIIMITSRTSEKHRERAFQIGVNRYLGKPYQESELLENLREVLEESGVQV
ncbi:MAG: response regulator [Xanthomonadaceae bacterium]|nr:response regulator [Xanthomonadaceae bacterium]